MCFFSPFQNHTDRDFLRCTVWKTALKVQKKKTTEATEGSNNVAFQKRKNTNTSSFSCSVSIFLAHGECVMWVGMLDTTWVCAQMHQRFRGQEMGTKMVHLPTSKSYPLSFTSHGEKALKMLRFYKLYTFIWR